MLKEKIDLATTAEEIAQIEESKETIDILFQNLNPEYGFRDNCQNICIYHHDLNQGKPSSLQKDSFFYFFLLRIIEDKESKNQ